MKAAQHPLIELTPAASHRLDRGLLESRGGFVWWYCDLVDPATETGLVLIWSFGLPFLPGYASAARRGLAPAPRSRPSLNLSLYREGRLQWYLLQEYGPQEATWSDCGDRWRFGDAEIVTGTDEATQRRWLRAELDCPLPGDRARLTGQIELDGPARLPHAHDSPLRMPVHDWTPLVGPSKGRARLEVQGCGPVEIEGRGYFDRNGGRGPLHELGIDRWLWGRIPFEDHERIYYLLWPEDQGEQPVCLGLTIDAEGRLEQVHDLEVELRGGRRAAAGMRWWQELTLRRGQATWLQVRHRRVLDDGPFYLRFFVEGRRRSEDGGRLGFGELCVPARVDLARHRPLVRMRVHHTSAPQQNSMWLPLFTGPKQGRLSRLVRHVFGQGGRGGQGR